MRGEDHGLSGSRAALRAHRVLVVIPAAALPAAAAWQPAGGGNGMNVRVGSAGLCGRHVRDGRG